MGKPISRPPLGQDSYNRLVLTLHADNHLCQVHEQTEQQEPQIICSLGLFAPAEGV